MQTVKINLNTFLIEIIQKKMFLCMHIFIPLHMKSKLLILAILISISFLSTSCMSSREGCKASQGYVGYGHR